MYKFIKHIVLSRFVAGKKIQIKTPFTRQNNQSYCVSYSFLFRNESPITTRASRFPRPVYFLLIFDCIPPVEFHVVFFSPPIDCTNFHFVRYAIRTSAVLYNFRRRITLHIIVCKWHTYVYAYVELHVRRIYIEIVPLAYAKLPRTVPCRTYTWRKSFCNLLAYSPPRDYIYIFV